MFQPLGIREVRLPDSVVRKMNTREQRSTELRQHSVGRSIDSTERTRGGTKKAKRASDKGKRKAPVEFQLHPFLIEILRQRTLYELQEALWKNYDAEWIRFEFARDQHLARPPIPPCCRTLPLHLYMRANDIKFKSLKAVPMTMKVELPHAKNGIELAKLADVYKLAKRRLQLCSHRVIDENTLVDMQEDMEEGHKILQEAGLDYSQKVL